MSLVTMGALGSGCSSADDSGSAGDAAAGAAATATAGQESGAADQGVGGPDEPVAADPVPFVPAGRPGTAEAYDELIARARAEIPPELRAGVPWPDLRDPDPVVAQQAIFDMWLWMAENYPEPVLVEVLAAPGSPSSGEVSAQFGFIDAANELEIRLDPGYRAFGQVVVTFESAGLPLWLTRDVPGDAVVVYYEDNSGPTEVRDRDSLEVLETRASTPTRTWLSIMVPTDAGWRLWRDELIEPNDPELEVPDIAPPGAESGRTVPEV